jgi:2-dehydropantoate 2-reductase
VNHAVAVIGAGGIGGYLADQLTRVTDQVDLCVRTPISRLRLTRAGETQPTEVKVNIVTDPLRLRSVEWIFLATKRHDTPSVRPWLAAADRQGLAVVLCQNGLPAMTEVAAMAPRARVLPALLYVSSEPVTPECVRHHEGNQMVVPETPLGGSLAQLLSGSDVDVVQVADFHTASWRKLLGNLASNPVCALTMRRLDALVRPELGALVDDLLREGLAVAKADGADLDETVLGEIRSLYQAHAATSGCSMLYDRLANKPVEREALTGIVVSLARHYNIPTPSNDVVYALLSAL